MRLFGYSRGYGYGRRRSSKGRLLIALVIAGIALFSYWSQTEVNPVTGEKQHIAMSVDQEKALGLQAAPEMAAQMGGVADPRSDPEARLVAEVGNRIVQKSDARKSPYVENFNFYLLNDARTINAFALPGGQIFITRGLFNALENEAQLAGVLGHEIGHVINRHAAEHMAKGRLGQMLSVAVGVGASEDGRGTQAAMAAMMVNQMLQLRFGRNDELESDRFGLDYMAQAGYDPSAMLGVMKVLAEASKGNRQPEFLQTHPHPENRVEGIRDYIARTYPAGVPTTLSQGRPLEDRPQPRLSGSRERQW